MIGGVLQERGIRVLDKLFENETVVNSKLNFILTDMGFKSFTPGPTNAIEQSASSNKMKLADSTRSLAQYMDYLVHHGHLESDVEFAQTHLFHETLRPHTTESLRLYSCAFVVVPSASFHIKWSQARNPPQMPSLN